MRIQGSAGVAPIECVNPRKDKWRVRWDIEERDGMATYEEAEFDRRPTLEEIKTAVLASYNARIDEAIRSGFRWEETPVWLSAENQFNYKAAFDLAVQTDELFSGKVGQQQRTGDGWFWLRDGGKIGNQHNIDTGD
ncbi:MAG: hypothetical protein BHV68_23435 [Bacteroidales bacterium 43_8]|nr:MAG: hypothetical protein BHV68_23435 [Bacteroidales bacterium 43_8]